MTRISRSRVYLLTHEMTLLCSGDGPEVRLWSQEARVSPGWAGRQGRGHQGQDLLRHLVLLHPVLGAAVHCHPGQLELGVEGRQELSVTRGE